MDTSVAPPITTPDAAAELVALIGRERWRERLVRIEREGAAGVRAARAARQRYAIEIGIEQARRGSLADGPSSRRLGPLFAEAIATGDRLPPRGRDRLVGLLRQAVGGSGTLVPVFHLLRTAAMQRARGFDVAYSGLAEAAPFDLLILRDGAEAEIVCDVVSAEEGRDVPRGAWFQLCDRIDPELQTWLAAHPGRYVLKMTLPRGLRRSEAGVDPLPDLHRRISALLAGQRRADHDEAAVLRLDPLLLAAAQADALGLVPRLRREFGPEAHLAVTASGGGLFVLAARAGREDMIAGAVRRRMAALAPARLSGARPGILAMFIDDTDPQEWRLLRDQMQLEGEARQFLTCPEARSVVAVSCASRSELLGASGADADDDGEMRFRNPQHPAAKVPGLSPAIASSM